MNDAIYRGPDQEFEIDSETQLWLHRMIIGEAGYNASDEHVSTMLWALTNRFLLYPGRKYWSSFLEMTRLFSQPINPRWQRGGDLARKYIARHGYTSACSKARLARREMICSIGAYDVPAQYLRLTYGFRNGTLAVSETVLKQRKNRVSNWAAKSHGIVTAHPQGFEIEGNWFLEDNGLSDGSVEVVRRYWK